MRILTATQKAFNEALEKDIKTIKKKEKKMIYKEVKYGKI